MEERHAGLLNITGALLKWSGTPVTLRVYPAPKAGGLLSSSCPRKLAPATGLAPAFSSVRETRLDCFVFVGLINGGRDGCCPRSLLLDRQANMLLLLASETGGRRRACSPGRCRPDLFSKQSRRACPVHLPKLAAPDGFAPSSADSESAVLLLDDRAVKVVNPEVVATSPMSD